MSFITTVQETVAMTAATIDDAFVVSVSWLGHIWTTHVEPILDKCTPFLRTGYGLGILCGFGSLVAFNHAVSPRPCSGQKLLQVLSVIGIASTAILLYRGAEAIL